MEELARQLEEYLDEFCESPQEPDSFDTDDIPFPPEIPIEENLGSFKEDGEINTDECKVDFIKLPNTDDLLDIKAIKTSVLGKEQAKKRLQAFCPTKKLERPKFLSVGDEEKLQEKQMRSKKSSRKAFDPSEKAKAVKEEIEEIKKIESAYHEALEQQFLFGNKKLEEKKRSRSRSRERSRKRSKREHKRSRSRSDRNKKSRFEQLRYPTSWKELKDKNFEIEVLPTLFPSEYQIDQHRVYDFRKQLLFQVPSHPLLEFIADGANGEPVRFPPEYIRFTKNQPSLPFCVNEKMPHDLLAGKGVVEYVPKHYRNILEQFRINNLNLCKPSSPTLTTSRKWYPKESTAFTLQETSLGLTFLQNYSDDDEQEKEENVIEEDIDSDGVIAEILEDIGKTELLLSKNNFNENPPPQEGDKPQSTELTDLVTKPSKKKKKKKKHKKISSKLKQKKSKHHKKDKAKKRKDKKASKEKKVLQQENDIPNKNVKEKSSSKQKSTKHRSRSKSETEETTSSNKHLQKDKKKNSTQDSTHKESKNTILEPEIFSEEKMEKKKKKIKRSRKRSSEAKEIREKKNEESTAKHKKINISDQKNKPNEIIRFSESDNEDGRTSEDLRKIIQEKQKILEEHDRREAELKSDILSERDDDYKKNTSKSKSEKRHHSSKNTEKKEHKMPIQNQLETQDSVDLRKIIQEKHNRRDTEQKTKVLSESDDDYKETKNKSKSEKRHHASKHSEKKVHKDLVKEFPTQDQDSNYEKKGKSHSKHKITDEKKSRRKGLSTKEQSEPENSDREKKNKIYHEKTQEKKIHKKHFRESSPQDQPESENSKPKKKDKDKTHSKHNKSERNVVIISETMQEKKTHKKESYTQDQSHIEDSEWEAKDKIQSKSERNDYRQGQEPAKKDEDTPEILKSSKGEQVQNHKIVEEGIYSIDELSNINTNDKNRDAKTIKEQIITKTTNDPNEQEENSHKIKKSSKQKEKKTEVTSRSQNKDIADGYYNEFEETIDLSVSDVLETEPILQNTGVSTESNENSSKETTSIKSVNKGMEAHSNIENVVCSGEKEIGTPNTEEYHSEWESHSDVTKPDVQNLSWESEDELLHGRDTKSYKNKENLLSSDRNQLVKGRHTNFSLDTPLIQKDRRQSEERRYPRSRERSLEKHLEMPFNINNVKRDRYNWRDERSSVRNLYDRSPDRIEMAFRLQNDKSFSLISEDSWEKNELLSIKDEEMRLEQERQSLLEERRKLEIEKLRFQELEQQRQQGRKPQTDDRSRNYKDRHHSQRDYDQFTLNNFLEDTQTANQSNKKPQSRWDVHNNSKPDIRRTSLKEDPKKHKKEGQNDKISVAPEKLSKGIPSTVKRPRRASESPEKLENEYEKFLELLVPEKDNKKASKKTEKLNDSKSTVKVPSTSSKAQIKKAEESHKRRFKKRSSSSSSSSLSSSSDSDSSSSSSTSSLSSSSSTSSSSSSYKKRKKKQLLKSKSLAQLKPAVSPTTTMKTKAIQVMKTEIGRSISTGTKPDTRDTIPKSISKDPDLIRSLEPERPLPVPSPRVVVNPTSRGPSNITYSKSIEVHNTELPLPGQKSKSDMDKILRKHDFSNLAKQRMADSYTSGNRRHTQDMKELVEDIRQDRFFPKRKRDDSSPRGRFPGGSPKRIRRRSISPYHPDSVRKRDYLSRRNDYSPRRRDYSPRKYNQNWSPSREHKQESIQEMLQKLANIDNLTSRKKSPVSSPVDGSKFIVADSTISDEQLLQYRVEEHLDVSKNFNRSLAAHPSPKRMGLDDRITQELGIPVIQQQKALSTTYLENYQYAQESQYYEKYHNLQQYNEANSRNNYRENSQPRTVNSNLLLPVTLEDRKVKLHHPPPLQKNEQRKVKLHHPPPLQQNEITNTTQRIKQVGNILEIIPTQLIEKPEMPQSSTGSPTIKSVSSALPPIAATGISTTTKSTASPTIKSVSSALSTTAATSISTTTKVTSSPLTVTTSTMVNVSTPSAKPLSPLFKSFSPISPTEFSPTSSTTSPLSSRDMNAKALIKEKMERRAEKDKKKLERELKREEKEKKRNIQESPIDTVVLDDDENKSSADHITVQSSNFQWPVPKIIFNSSHKPPEKGILKETSLLKSMDEMNQSLLSNRKSVRFSDGVFPGEGTSPSGGEELSSPPPAPKKLPKEKRYKKTKIPKAAKVPKKKKVKVKVVRRAEEEDEDDDLPPPPPPPGSPPSHLYPARIKTVINNIHPTVAVSISNSILQPDTSLVPSPLFRPALNLPHQRPQHQQSSALQQHNLGAFNSSMSMPAGTGLPQQQHHIGHNNNQQQSSFISHHRH